MPETVNLLEKAAEHEAKKFLELVASLEGDQLHEFIHLVSEPKLSSIESTGTISDIINIAQNVRNINDALNNFYVA
jgi:hypothetical protein